MASSDTQYDQISTPYATFYPSDPLVPSAYAIEAVEEHNIKHAILSALPSLSGKRVLDLACGNGYLTFRLLKWGAAEVVGCDISEGMLRVAQSEAQRMGVQERVRFVAGDVAAERLDLGADADANGDKFDLVTAAWLLNYAADTETMTRIWRNIARSLKPGGVFVGLTIPPVQSNHPAERDLLDAAFAPDGAWGKVGLRGKVLKETDSGEGFLIKLELGFPEQGHQVAAFENYYLRKECFQRSCSDSGGFDGLEWMDFLIPETSKTGEGRYLGEWNDVALLPPCRVCVARRRV